MSEFSKLVDEEKNRISEIYGKEFSSLHEAYAILLEEVEEFWEIVKQKQDLRNPDSLLMELVQIGACVELIANSFIQFNDVDVDKSRKEYYNELLAKILLSKEINKVKTPDGNMNILKLSEEEVDLIKTCKITLQ